MLFVFGAETAENGDSLVDGGGIDPDGLEAALEGGVLLDVLAVFVHRGGADALQFSAGESGLDDVGSVHGAFGRAGADQGVKLVDEEDDALELADLLHDGLDALLELAAVFGAGDHEG